MTQTPSAVPSHTRTNDRLSPRTWLARHPEILVVLLVSLLIRGALVGREFIGNEEGTVSGIPMCVARNYLRYGVLASRGAGIMNTGFVEPPQWVVYSHHPPLTALASSLSMLIAGNDSEAACRAPAALFTIANTFLIYLIVLKSMSGLSASFAARRFTAAAAAALYAFCPMTLAFGDMPDYVGVQVVFCALLTIHFYAIWRETRKTVWLYPFAAAFLLGTLTDWPIFYLVPLLGIHFLLADGLVSGTIRFIPFGVVATCLLLMLGGWMLWSGGDVSLGHQLTRRMMGEHDQGAIPITPLTWMQRVVGLHIAVMHTIPVLLLALFYLYRVGRETLRRQREKLGSQLMPMLLVGFGAVHLLVGGQGNFQHVFWGTIFTPGLCVAAAIGGYVLVQRWRTLTATPARRWSGAAAASLLFVAMSVPPAWSFLFVPYEHLRSDPYSQKELGLAIRQISAPEEGVLTSDSWMECALWFYADRQLRINVSSPEKLDESLQPGHYLLPFNYIQNEGPAPRWFVLPHHHRERLPLLAAELDRRFPSRRTVGKFDVYELR